MPNSLETWQTAEYTLRICCLYLPRIGTAATETIMTKVSKSLSPTTK